MKGHRLLFFLTIAILWVFSLAVVGYAVAPDIALDQNPQTKDYNSSKSNTTSIKVGEDERGDWWVGLVSLTDDGDVRAGTHGGNSVKIEWDEYGNIIVGELERSPEFDGLVLEALDEALSQWAIATNEEGISKEK